MCIVLCDSNLIFFFTISVLGALIGKQKGRNIEVMNSFELLCMTVNNDTVIDKDYYNTKEAQCMYYCRSVILVKLSK